MIPILELRGGLLAASLLKVSAAKAIPICIIGNIIPIPFILLFIRQIFKVLKKTKLFHGLIVKMEDRAMGKSDQIKRYEFFGFFAVCRNSSSGYGGMDRISDRIPS